MQRRKHKTRVAAWLLTLIMMFSLVPGGNVQVQAAGSGGTSTQAADAVTAVFGNNGYPYGKEMSDSSVTLVADLAEGISADSVQWQTSSAKNGTYSNISGATELEYTFTPTVDNWYRCVVNGTYSRSVQLKKEGSSDFTIRGGKQSGYWYITNGAVGYTYNGTKFDTTGSYRLSDKTYCWIGTAFSSNGWSMFSSENVKPVAIGYGGATAAKLNKFMISFDEKQKYSLHCLAQLQSTERAFSIGTDVCLGDGTTSGAYSDSASLKAIYDKQNNLKQIQMVGSASVDDASESDPSFVLQYVTVPGSYWLGHYSSRMQYSYNSDTTNSSHGMKDSKVIDNNTVITEVAGIDSGMTSSWTNLEAGATVQFNFNVGSVADTGASIGTTSEATSSSITYKELPEGFVFILQTSEDGSNWTNVEGADWIEPDENMSITYPGTREGTKVTIKENTSYRLMGREKGDSSGEGTKVDGGDVTTNVDPTVPDKDSSEEQGKITIATEWNTITLGNVRSNYEYQLQDEYGEAVTGWLSGDEEKKITFSDLDEETTYYLVAKETNKDSKSDQYPITTPEHPRLNLTYVGNFGEEEVNVPDKVEAGVPWKKEYTLSDVVPTKSTEDKYQFIGWSTKADAAEAEYQPGDKVKFDQDTTLYAIWKMPLTYTAEDVNVTYDGQPHNIKVVVTEPDNAVITYGAGKDAIADADASYTDAGTYTIWYQIAAPDYQIVRDSKTLTITKATPTLKLENKICMTDGEKGTIDAAIVTGADGNVLEGGSITYTYYTDKACTQKTTTDNSGAESDGKEPTKKGTYFVKAVRSEDTNYKEAVSNVAKLIIAPDVYFEDENGDRQYCSFEDAFNPDVNTKQATVYVAGNTIVDSDVTVPEGFTLEISGGATLTILEEVTFTNNGDISNEKNTIISGKGTFINNGSVTYGKMEVPVINTGIMDHPELSDTVTNKGTIQAPTASKITNEAEGTVVTKANKVITRTITFDAKNHLTEDIAGSVENPSAVTIPWGDRLATLSLPDVADITDVAEFEGWYIDAECTKPAVEEAMGVNTNINLYAKWIEFSSYEAYWTDQNGDKHYGSLDDVLKDIASHPEDVKDVHIQKEVEIQTPGATLPDDVPLIVDESGKIILDNDASLKVPGGIENKGTIGAKDSEAENQPKIEAPITNQAPGTISDVQITGNVENENNASMSNTNITGDLTNHGKVDGGKVDGNVTNKEDGVIRNTEIDDDQFDNDGIYNNKPSGSDTETEVTFTVKFFVNGSDSDVESQTVKRAAKVTEPGRPTMEEGNVFSGWYADEACTTLWKFDKNKVTKDIALYAKVDLADHFESYWQDEEGNQTYGSLKDAFASESKDIHIINSCKVSEDTTTVDGVTITVEGDAALTVSAGKKFTVNGTLQNDGTIRNNGTVTGQITNNGMIQQKDDATINGTKLDNQGSISGGNLTFENVQNGQDASIGNATINGSVTNDGEIKGSTLNGTTVNNGEIKKSNLNNDAINNGLISGGTIAEGSIVQNNKKIENTDIQGDVINGDNGKVKGEDDETKTFTVTYDSNGHDQKIDAVVIAAGAKIVDEPVLDNDIYDVFNGWYTAKDGETKWNFTKNTVSRDITLYAHWTPKADYEARWTDANGKEMFGTLDEAIQETENRDIHIQKDISITTDTRIPENVTVTIDKSITVTITGNGQLEVPGGLVNEGTIQTADSTVTPQIIGKVENAGGATIKDAAIAGDVNNEKDGQITGSKIEGNVDNEGDINGTTVAGDVTNTGNIKDAEIKADKVANKEGGVITGGNIVGNTPEKQPEVTNAAGAAISGTDITGKVDNTGTISDSKLDGETTNGGSISGSTVAGKVTNEKGGTITAGTVKGETTNNGTISGSTVNGNVTNNGNLEGVITAPDAKVDNSNPDATMKDAEGQEITYKVTFDANGHGAAPEAQTVAYGKIATKPADLQDDAYTMRGWYKDADCKTAWDFEKDVVTGDVTIYAKWSLKTEFEAIWKTEDGKDAFGSLEEAVAAGGKDIHIQNDLTIEKDLTIPEGTTVTVEENATVTIPEGVTVSVPENTELINNGTVKNQSKIDGEGNVTNNGTLQGNSDSTVNTTVVNNGRVSDSQLNGAVENNGVVKDTTLNGSVKNNNAGKLNDCEINAGLKNHGKVTVDGDEVVYEDQTVKGMVTKGDNKESVDNTTITFQQGNDKKVGSGDVNDGFYQVDKLPNGYYNVVIPSEDGKVNTFFVTVTDDEIQMKEFNLPDGNLSDQVVVKEGTPKIVVDGLAQMLTDMVENNTAGVTSEDQRVAKNGGDVDVTFTAAQIDAIPNDDIDLEKVITDDKKSVGMNLDLSVLKTVTITKGDDTTKTETYLTELNKPIMVYIPIPSEKQGKKGYAIYRSHIDQNGKVSVDKITDEKNQDGEYIEVAKDGSAITLYTKKFSTYVLAFDPDKTQESDKPDESDDKSNEPEHGSDNSTQQTTTEAPKTSSGLEALTKQQQKDAKKVMQSLGLTEAEAVEIMKFAIDNNISMDTLLVSDTTITSQKNDKDIKGSSFAHIQAATSKLDKTSVKLKWNKVAGADGYLVFGNKCGKSNKYQFIKDVKGVKTTLLLKKLKKGTYYKYVVRAYKLVGDKKVTIALSKTVHATTKGGKYGVAKAVKVNKSKVSLKTGKTFTIKASEIKESKTIKHHRDIVYESSNTAIATVDKHGVVKAVKKGSCYIYVYAQNGVYKKIKVTVK